MSAVDPLTETVVFIVHALKRLSYGFRRLDEVADSAEDGSPKKASQITLASCVRQKEERDPAIVIKPVAGRKGEYLAYCRSAYLDATYAVYFKDSLMGGLALHSFIKMVERKYEKRSIRVPVSEEELLFKNEALLDVLADTRTDKINEKSEPDEMGFRTPLRAFPPDVLSGGKAQDPPTHSKGDCFANLT